MQRYCNYELGIMKYERALLMWGKRSSFAVEIVLNMEKCRNELVSPVINNNRLREEIITKMHYLLNRDYKQILNPRN